MWETIDFVLSRAPQLARAPDGGGRGGGGGRGERGEALPVRGQVQGGGGEVKNIFKKYF